MHARFMLAVLLCLVTPVAARAASFVVTSSEFADNGPAPRAGAQPQCGGGSSSSPALAWTGAPAATKSYVIVVTDVDAWGPGGFLTHWIAYGIPASVSAVPPGFGSETPPHYVPGLNVSNEPGFRGYCPPKGAAPHHYVYTVLATDLAPDALAPGLTRDALPAALDGHRLAGASVIARYAQAP
jgi:Raf kinase inhibitor-like YbhB/YbcL family protein